MRFHFDLSGIVWGAMTILVGGIMLLTAIVLLNVGLDQKNKREVKYNSLKIASWTYFFFSLSGLFALNFLFMEFSSRPMRKTMDDFALYGFPIIGIGGILSFYFIQKLKNKK